MKSRNENGTSCCSSGEASVCSLERKAPPWITDWLTTPVGNVPQVATSLQFADRLGSFKARWNIGRINYSIEPGLYAVGTPSPESLALVSASYKMSFDRLRSELAGRFLWILILDTQGINVWCAASKGTFSTAELVHRIGATRLHDVVSHRTLILPQLGAPGVAAHEVPRGAPVSGSSTARCAPPPCRRFWMPE